MQSLSLAACAAVWSLTTASAALATGCFPIAERQGGIQLASLELAAIPQDATVEIRYLGHSSYAIETRDGITAVTDFNGTLSVSPPPTVVTMNNAHSTHWTPFPDPAIEHVLHGWSEGNSIATHDVEIGDLRVRNVPTSVHGRSGAQANSNSIFVFEVRDLCIAHLGHLHHVLEDTHLGELGVIDILMVPIDGAYTMSQAEMAMVVDQIDPAVVLPMHYFGQDQLARFLALLGEGWDVDLSVEATVAFSRDTLPSRRLVVLPISRG